MIHLREEEMTDYVNNLLNTEHSMKVKQHLSVCEPCQKQTLLIQELLMEWQQPSVSSSIDLTDQVMKKIAESAPTVSRTPRASKWKNVVNFGLAATAAILFSVFNASDIVQEKSEKAIHSVATGMEEVETTIKENGSLLGSITINWNNGGDIK